MRLGSQAYGCYCWRIICTSNSNRLGLINAGTVIVRNDVTGHNGFSLIHRQAIKAWMIWVNS